MIGDEGQNGGKIISTTEHHGLTYPLRIPVFRRIWVASVLSNLGLLILGVGAAWAMTRLTVRADMVALIQTALMMPVMLVALAAGAIADMFDRRKVKLAALTVSLVGSMMLTLVTISGLLQPWSLLALCFLVGCGMALFGPAWQASVSEQVPPNALAPAIALNSISYNIARSFGPALGGLIVAAAGAMAAFAANALLYIPMMLVLLFWRRTRDIPRLPPERLGRAITSGVRYLFHSPPLRTVLARTLLTGLAGGSLQALMPIVARDLIGGEAEVYGLILGAFGIGSVMGAVLIPRVLARLSSNDTTVISALLLSLCIAAEGFSHSLPLTALILVVAGMAWMLAVTMFNMSIQLSSPRWVAGRTLAAFQAAIAGGIAIGSWIWGSVAQQYGVSTALLISAGAMLLTALVGRWLRLPESDDTGREPAELGVPETALALTGRSGPIVIEVEYCVDPDKARAFYIAMQDVQLVRHRNGAYDWSISRDIHDPTLWKERFQCPTWLDYLRQRSRQTVADAEAQQRAAQFYDPHTMRVRRSLERPFGSVRWHEDAPDPKVNQIIPGGGS